MLPKLLRIEFKKSLKKRLKSMTYNRLEAKPIKGEYCRFCGDKEAPLVKTECCHQWACCDTAFISYRGGGYCQFDHEYQSPCHFHFNEKHSGLWNNCKECEEFWGSKQFKMLSGLRGNIPYYPKDGETDFRSKS